MMEGEENKKITRKQVLKQLGGLALGVGLIPPLISRNKGMERFQTQDNLRQFQLKQTKQPHIIFLMADQFRADALGCAGNNAVITPNLDAIARDGILFTNAYSSVPSCTPARSCLLTGMNPWNNGMLGFGRLAQEYKYEMPRMIRQAGYYTYVIGKNNWFPCKSLHGFNGALIDSEDTIFQDGYVSNYHDWFKFHAPNEDPNKTGLGWNSYHARAYALREELHPTYWTGKTAVDFIQNYNLEAPLFLKVSWVRPHSPYDPPQRFVDMYNGAKIPPPVIGGNGSWDEEFAHYHPDDPDTWLGNFGNAQAIKSRRYYYANITFVDEWIGRVVAALKEKGMYENSIITFCADHGDMLGDHYHWRKTYPYEGSAAIPFIFKWPVTFETSIKRGSKRNEPVGLQDFLPTFLEATGQQIPEDMDGMSLLRLVRGNNEGWRRYIGMEHATVYWQENYWAAATDGRFKYIWYFSPYPSRFFDLEKDPGEVKNILSESHISSEMQQEMKKWEGYLIDYLKPRGSGFVKNNHLIKRKKTMLYSPNYPHFTGNKLNYWQTQYFGSYKIK